MLVTNQETVRSGTYDKSWTALLIGESNTGCPEISIQITHIQPGGEQSLHTHPEHQCYYILEGTGRMTVGDEQRDVSTGEAVYIPGGSLHGIRNIGVHTLSYITANKAFGLESESRTWPDRPRRIATS